MPYLASENGHASVSAQVRNGPREPLKVLIVGGTGLLGHHAAQELLNRGHSVTILARQLPGNPLPSAHHFKAGVLETMADEELRVLLFGHDAMVYATGADEREVPMAPAYEHYRRGNVDSCKRVVTLAREAGVKRAVVLGSYFVHFHRLWPELRLADRHPYIRSRLEQENEAFEAAGKELSLCVLELPYIFGSLPGREPVWTFLIEMLRSSRTVFFPRGGTAMVTVRQVTDAIIGALDRGEAGMCYQIGGRNLEWTEFIGKLLSFMGEEKRIVTVPTFLAKLFGIVEKMRNRRRGRERGLDPVAFMDLQSRRTFIDPQPAMQALGYGDDDLDSALRETVDAWAASRKLSPAASN